MTSGKIHELKSQITHHESNDRSSHENGRGTYSIPLDAKDVYTELRLTGYDYGPAFQNIFSLHDQGKFDDVYCFSAKRNSKRLCIKPNNVVCIAQPI